MIQQAPPAPATPTNTLPNSADATTHCLCRGCSAPVTRIEVGPLTYVIDSIGRLHVCEVRA